MRGLEIARAFFDEYGMPALRAQAPELLPFIAAGLTGSGSECYGYDDEISRDHDFEPGFCILIPGEDVVSSRQAFQLERIYDSLPREYMGLRRQNVKPVGGARHGVFRLADFYLSKAGTADGTLTDLQWLALPDSALAEATNGELFYDGPGEAGRIREKLRNRPEAVRLKKLAGHLLLMAQAGQYNYERCLRRRESGAAQLSAILFAQHCMQAVFLLNRVYQPYYKWSFRAMRALPRLSLLAELLEYLITTDNDGRLAQDKMEAMEGIAKDLIAELRRQELTAAAGETDDLERHAYSVQERIRDAGIRNMNILAGV